jgi:multiple sugar transport system permease protein
MSEGSCRPVRGFVATEVADGVAATDEPLQQGGRLGGRSVLAMLAVLPFAVPFVWLVLSAEARRPVLRLPPTALPDPPSLENLAGAVGLVDVPQAARELGPHRRAERGRDRLVGLARRLRLRDLPAAAGASRLRILIATILVPPSATLVPQFILFSRLGWVGNYLPLVVPHLCGSAYRLPLPAVVPEPPRAPVRERRARRREPAQAWWHVAMPLAKPAIAAVAVFAFVGSWNDFLGPLLYLRSPRRSRSAWASPRSRAYVNQLHYTWPCRSWRSCPSWRSSSDPALDRPGRRHGRRG